MGVSILSLIEILYYITLRLACNLKYRRNKKIKARQNSLYHGDQVPGIKIGYNENEDESKND